MRRHRIVAACVRPVAGEDVVRLAAEEQGVGARRHVDDAVAHVLVPVVGAPPTVLETTLAILVLPAGCLVHAIDGEERADDQSAHAVHPFSVAERNARLFH